VYLICSPDIHTTHTFSFIWAHLLQDALTVLGVDAKEQDAIFQIMAAILHLGNMQVGTPPPLCVCL
jgi:truncated hemoglobin YjbI